MAITIDPEFAALIPPLTPEELSQLEANILEYGCRDALKVWAVKPSREDFDDCECEEPDWALEEYREMEEEYLDGLRDWHCRKCGGWCFERPHILLDGHNRIAICQKHNLPYDVQDIDLPDRNAAADWIDANQLGRRNLKPDQMSLLRGRRYNRAKKAQGGTGANQHTAQIDQIDTSAPTADKLAKEHGVSAPTIKRDGAFADAVEKLKAAEPEIEKRITSGHGPARSAVVMAAKLLEEHPEAATAVLQGQKTVKDVKKVIKKEAKAKAKAAIPADLPATTDRYTIHEGELSVAGDKVEPASVDWIITDPPYPQEFLPVYSDLSTFAARVLKPGGSLVCMVGQSYLPEIITRLTERLTYQWTLAYLTPGGQAVQLWDRQVNTFWKPLLWLTNGKYTGDWIGDVCRSDVNDNDKNHHHWGQSESGMADIIDRFTYPGQTICDPFCGGGTTGVVAVQMNRLFVGIDSAADAVATTLQRLAGVANA